MRAPRGVVGFSSEPMKDGATRPAEAGKDLVEWIKPPTIVRNRRDKDDVLALRAAAARSAQAMAGHARRVVINRAQAVAVATERVVGHPFLGEEDFTPR